MQPRILVVDDDALARKNICVFLQENGFEVVEAGDGKEAVGLLHRDKMDLVITDIRMPQLNGLLLHDIVKSTFPRTSILLMSAYYADLIKHAVDPDGFVAKPIVFEELLAKAQKLLNEGPSAVTDRSS